MGCARIDAMLATTNCARATTFSLLVEINDIRGDLTDTWSNTNTLAVGVWVVLVSVRCLPQSSVHVQQLGGQYEGHDRAVHRY